MVSPELAITTPGHDAREPGPQGDAGNGCRADDGRMDFRGVVS